MFITTPTNFPPTFCIFFITLSKLSFLVSLCAVTITVASATLDKITESVTNSHGVPSITIKSHTCFKSSNNFVICGETNNSDGFGGIFPAGINNKFSISVFCKYIEISVSSGLSISISDK